MRPISILGAELEYIDFGHPSTAYDPNNSNANGFDSHPRAGVLFGVGYLPLPIPFIDIYGKAGVARLQTDVTTTTSNCPSEQIAWFRPPIPATTRPTTGSPMAWECSPKCGASHFAPSTSGSARSSATRML